MSLTKRQAALLDDHAFRALLDLESSLEFVAAEEEDVGKLTSTSVNIGKLQSTKDTDVGKKSLAIVT